MLNKLMKKYALSETGAKDFIKATINCTITDILLMLPVSLMYLLVNDLLNEKIPNNHYVIYIGGIIVTVILLFISYYFQYNSTFISTYKESGRRRISLAEHLRKLPLSYFGKKDLSDLTNIILNDATKIEHNFSHEMPQFFGSIISTCIIAVSLFFFNVKMAIASLWVLPVALIIVGASSKVQNKFNKKKDNAVSKCNDGIQECIETVRDLKSYNASENYLKTLNTKIKEVEKRSIFSELGIAIFVESASLLLKFGIGTTALVGSVLLINGEINIITFFMYLLVVSRIYEPMSNTLINLASIISSDINTQRMNEIQDYPVQKGSINLNNKGYDIEFKDVSFSYNNDEQVLNNVSFIAKQGEVTALIGPSGSGKSTISKLCARFWDIPEGKITLGGVDISKIDPETLLKAYSIVFQDVILFNNTILENIRIGKKDATDKEVLIAAKKAECDEFINKLPDGYNTMIGENGSDLSGGERQRISIARALLKDAPVILLDEATASLDAENETQIQSAISKLIKNKTVIIIAHRMRTVTQANKIVVLKNEKVAETGMPEVLIKQNSLFASMVKKQKQSLEWKLEK